MAADGEEGKGSVNKNKVHMKIWLGLNAHIFNMSTKEEETGRSLQALGRDKST